jgi:hypothetical protein
VSAKRIDAIARARPTAVGDRCPAAVYDDLPAVMTHLDALTAGQALANEGL